MLRKIALTLGAFFIFLVMLVTHTQAGGGNYSIRIVKQGVVGKSPAEVVATVYDFSGAATHKDSYGTGLTVGEEFRFHAHGDTANERCETTQSKSDDNGEVRALCYSNKNGRIEFHIEPLSKRDLGDSPTTEIIFKDPSDTGLSTMDQNYPTSKAAGPCNSGMNTLQFDYPNECGRGDMKSGKVLCNNGYVAVFTSPTCVSQGDEGYWQTIEDVCKAAACTASQVSSIPRGVFTLTTLGAPAPTSKKPTVKPSPKPADAYGLQYLLVENQTDTGARSLDVYLKAQLLSSAQKQAYILPFSSFKQHELQIDANIVAADQDPWNDLATRYHIEHTVTENLASQYAQLRVFKANDMQGIVDFISQHGAQLDPRDSAYFKKTSTDNKEVVVLILDESSVIKNQKFWSPAIKVSHTAYSVQEFFLPFTWFEHFDKTATPTTDIELIFVTFDPFLAKNKSFVQSLYKHDQSPLILADGTQAVPPYLSTLRLSINPNESDVLSINRADPDVSAAKPLTLREGMSARLAPMATSPATTQSASLTSKLWEFWWRSFDLAKHFFSQQK